MKNIYLKRGKGIFLLLIISLLVVLSNTTIAKDDKNRVKGPTTLNERQIIEAQKNQKDFEVVIYGDMDDTNVAGDDDPNWLSQLFGKTREKAFDRFTEVVDDEKSKIKDYVLEQDKEIVNTNFLGVGVKFKSKPLDPIYVYRRPGRMVSDFNKQSDVLAKDKKINSWFYTKFGIKTKVPLTRSIPTGVSGLSLNIGVKPNASRYYAFIVNTDVPFTSRDFPGGGKIQSEKHFRDVSKTIRKHTKDIIKTAKKRVKMSVSAIKKMRFSTDPMYLTEMYLPGTEIIKEGNKGIVTTFGVGYGVAKYASASLGVVVNVDSFFRSTFKVLYSANQDVRVSENRKSFKDDKIHNWGDRQKFYKRGRFVRYRLEKFNNNSKGISVGVGIGTTLFDIGDPEGDYSYTTKVLGKEIGGETRTTGNLRVNILNLGYSKGNKDKLIYDYTFNLDVPEAYEALKSMMAGNLVPAKHAAITLADPMRAEKDKGVYINSVAEEAIVNSVARVSVGIDMSASSLDNKILGISKAWSLGQKFGEIFKFDSNWNTTVGSLQREDSDGTKSENKYFNYSKNKRSHLLWGLLTDYTTQVVVQSQLLKGKMVVDGMKTQDVQNHKLIVHHRHMEKKDSKKRGKISAFLNRAAHITSMSERSKGHVMESAIDKCYKTLDDDSPVELVYQGIFYREAIKQIISYTPRQLMVRLASFLHLKDNIDYKMGNRKVTHARQWMKFFLDSEYRDYINMKNVKKKKFARKRYKKTYDYVLHVYNMIKKGEQNGAIPDVSSHYSNYDLWDTIWDFEHIFWKKFYKKIVKLRSKHSASNSDVYYIKNENKVRLAELLKDLFEEYEEDSFPFRFLAYLASDVRGKSSNNLGMFLNYRLTSEGCNYNWSQNSDIMYKLNDFEGRFKSI